MALPKAPALFTKLTNAGYPEPVRFSTAKSTGSLPGPWNRFQTMRMPDLLDGVALSV
jgi:hypothetical protein